ncbi:MAG: hypothetical protein JWM98_446 [Thermoleophilia bacterium]|nr:hypothetical protein [Thermoleophilia bacterium]
MQQLVNPQIPAQHLPQGWGYPPVGTHPMAPPAPTSGGGVAVAASTATRVRWGRLVPVIAGIALIAFGVWTFATGNVPGSGSHRSGQTVSGGGGTADDVDVAKSERADNTLAITPPATTPKVTAPKVPARRSTGHHTTHRVAGTGGTGAIGTPRAVAAPGTVPARTVGGGGGPAAQLPYTGASTWIAAIIGLLLLAVGICVHVNAVRIGMTAMLYRRGILLRPLECARLAQSHAPARLRVTISNALHRLLEEPAGGSDYVSARLTR